LDGAVQVFRERGYYAASLADLRAAMRLASGSIYKAFRDKRALFLAAFDRYTARRAAHVQRAIEGEASGRNKLRAMLNIYVEASLGDEGRRGCLVVASAAELSIYDPDMAGMVGVALQRVETRLRDLIRLGQADGSISPSVDAEVAARALLCFLQGLRVVGKVGRSRAEMVSAADHAMRLLS
jgi:TetR/AcrR family transcriptional regulator, transcriptional repressor for nem operon